MFDNCILKKERNNSKGIQPKKLDRRFGSGYSSIYKQNDWKNEQKKFEFRLGQYAYKSKRSYNSVNIALDRMKIVLKKYYSNRVNDETEFYIKVFTTDLQPYSAGQVGSRVGEDIRKIINMTIPEFVDAEIGNPSSGNLREKMTAFYNAAYNNAEGLSKIGKKSAINFKNIMQLITTKVSSIEAKYLIDKLELNKESVLATRKQMSKNVFVSGFLTAWNNRIFGSDVYSCAVMAFNSKDKTDSYVNNLQRFGYRNEKSRNDVLRPFAYQDQIGLKSSDREFEYQKSVLGIDIKELKQDSNLFLDAKVPNSNDDDDPIVDKIKTIDKSGIENSILNSPIHQGEWYKQIKFKNPLSNAKKLRDKNGFHLISGTSGTTGRLLNTCKWLGLSHSQLLDFRLALMGWMLPERDHSLYEILHGSHVVGVYGDEDMSDARSMDETISPLSEDELRENCGEEINSSKLFPIEVMLWKMFFKGNNLDGDLKKLSAYNFNLPYYSKASIKYFIKKLAVTSYTESDNHEFINQKLAFNGILGNSFGNKAIKAYWKPYILFGLQEELLNKFVNRSGDYNGLMASFRGKNEKVKKIRKTSLKYTELTSKIAGSNILSHKIANDSHFKDILNGSYTDKKREKKILKYTRDMAKKILNDNNIMEKLLTDTDIMSNELLYQLSKFEKYKQDSTMLYSCQWMAKSGSKYRKGNTIKLKEFLSSSKSKQIAAGFMKSETVATKPCLFVIKPIGKKGVDVEKISAHGFEREVLFLPGTKLKVTYVGKEPLNDNDRIKCKNKRYITYVYMEEI